VVIDRLWETAVQAQLMTATGGLDQILLDPTRLSIVALLASTEWAEFSWVRDSVELSDSALSKQVTKLAAAEYVEVEKGYVGKRPRTWLNLTDAGRAALGAHVAAMQDIVEQAARRAEEHGPGGPAERDKGRRRGAHRESGRSDSPQW